MRTCTCRGNQALGRRRIDRHLAQHVGCMRWRRLELVDDGAPRASRQRICVRAALSHLRQLPDRRIRHGRSLPWPAAPVWCALGRGHARILWTRRSCLLVPVAQHCEMFRLYFAVGDSRALPYASQCDLLLVDTSAPRWSQLPSENGTESPPSEQPLSRWQRQRRAEFKQSLLAGLGPALEAASRNAGSVVIIHGPQCTAGTARVDRTGVHCTSAEHCYPATDSSFKAVRCWSSLFRARRGTLSARGGLP